MGKTMPEQERLNHLMARFLRLNDEGKGYMNSVTRRLTHILGTPVKPGCGIPPAREEACRESGAVSGLDDTDGTYGPKEQDAAGL
jgi:hypothetical protein